MKTLIKAWFIHLAVILIIVSLYSASYFVLPSTSVRQYPIVDQMWLVSHSLRGTAATLDEYVPTTHKKWSTRFYDWFWPGPGDLVDIPDELSAAMIRATDKADDVCSVPPHYSKVDIELILYGVPLRVVSRTALRLSSPNALMSQEDTAISQWGLLPGAVTNILANIICYCLLAVFTSIGISEQTRNHAA